MEIICKEESYAIPGACFEVHKGKGCGFLEAVYQARLEIEIGRQNIPAVPQPRLELNCKGRLPRQNYVPDFICYGKIVLERKSVSALNDEHRAQVLNQLRATGHKLGLLVNFGHDPQWEYERIVL